MPTIITQGAASAKALGFTGNTAASVPTLIAPLGLINKGSDGVWYFFNVDTETFVAIPSSSSSTSDMQFDPITGNIYTQSDTSGSTQKWWTPNSTKTNWDYQGTFTQQGAGYNGVNGWGWGGYNWNIVNSGGTPTGFGIYTIPSGGSVGTGPSASSSGTEDMQCYGNIAYRGNYDTMWVTTIASTSSFVTQTSLGGFDQWGTLCYDNRTGLFTKSPYASNNTMYVYGNKYSAGAYGTTFTDETLGTAQTYSSASINDIYGSSLMPVDTSTVGGSRSSYIYTQRGSSGELSYGTNSSNFTNLGNYTAKTSWVWSYKNKAYYSVGPSGAIKVTMTGPYQLSSSPSFISSPATMNGWRGMRATNGQLPCYIFNKNVLPYA